MKKLLFVILLALFAVFVWPTRYKHYPAGEGPYATEVPTESPTRVDRITGEVAVQDASGQWHTFDNTNIAPAFEQPAVDPNATARPSASYNQGVVDQQRNAVEQTQAATQSATEQQQ